MFTCTNCWLKERENNSPHKLWNIGLMPNLIIICKEEIFRTLNVHCLHLLMSHLQIWETKKGRVITTFRKKVYPNKKEREISRAKNP